MWPRRAALELGSQLEDDFFCFSFYDMIRLGDSAILCTGDGATHHGAQASGFATRNLRLHRGALNQHAAQENQVCPVEVGILQPPDVEVNETFLPVVGKKG